MSSVNIDIKAKENFGDSQLHNILRHFDVLPNFPSSTSEAMRDYYLKTLWVQVVSGAAARLTT